MTRSHRVVAVVVLGFLAVGLCGAAAVSGASGSQQAGLAGDGPMQSGFDSDSVSMGIDLTADGDARWTITYRIQLDDENATEAFQQVRENVEQNASEYVDRFRDRMSRTVVTAENATGREMAIDNVTVAATAESLPQGEYGVVRYRFTWVNFAVVDGESITAGDAIEELFLEDGTSLTITAPDGYRLEASTPPADDPENPVREVTWHGRQDFGSGEPNVVFVRDDGGGGGGNGDGTDVGGSSGSATSVVLVAVVALLLASGAWLFARRAGLTVPLGGSDDGDGTAGASSAGGGTGEAGAPPDEPPEELLSNEERVLRLLRDNSGRMKQQQVAEQLDWTAAKTSQVVGDLREADKVEAFRLGRENVLTLPDVSVEPEAGDEAEPDT